MNGIINEVKLSWKFSFSPMAAPRGWSYQEPVSVQPQIRNSAGNKIWVVTSLQVTIGGGVTSTTLAFEQELVARRTADQLSRKGWPFVVTHGITLLGGELPQSQALPTPHEAMQNAKAGALHFN